MIHALRAGRLILRILWLILAVTATIQFLDGAVTDWSALVIVVGVLLWLIYEDRKTTREIEELEDA